jgi:hypothetical protein
VRSAIRRLRDRLRYLDLRLKGSKEVTVRVIERPGCWMSAADCQALVEEMRDVTRRGIGTDLDYGVLSGDAERLRNAVVTLALVSSVSVLRSLIRAAQRDTIGHEPLAVRPLIEHRQHEQREHG